MHLEMAAFRPAAEACDAQVTAESPTNSAIKSILAIFMFPLLWRSLMDSVGQHSILVVNRPGHRVSRGPFEEPKVRRLANEISPLERVNFLHCDIGVVCSPLQNLVFDIPFILSCKRHGFHFPVP